MNILIVEDDIRVARFVKRIIESVAVVNIIEMATSFDAGFTQAMSGIFDIVLLDIFLGEENHNGLDLCQIIRRHNTKIILIMLTSSNTICSLEKAFQAGANDYISKPFRPRELILRVERWMQLHAGLECHDKILYKDVWYDVRKNEFYYQNRKLPLTKQQKRLFLLFLKQPEELISTAYLREKFWGDYPHIEKPRNLRSNIHLLRNSLAPCCHTWIHTVPGEGYILEKKS